MAAVAMAAAAATQSMARRHVGSSLSLTLASAGSSVSVTVSGQQRHLLLGAQVAQAAQASATASSGRSDSSCSFGNGRSSNSSNSSSGSSSSSSSSGRTIQSRILAAPSSSSTYSKAGWQAMSRSSPPSSISRPGEASLFGRSRWSTTSTISAAAAVLPHEMDCIVHWAAKQPTPVTLRDLCELGLDMKRRRQHGIFLHSELRIRIAQRVLELQQLPFGLADRAGIQTVIRWYTDHLMQLEEVAVPETGPKDGAFTNLLSRIFEEHTEVIQQLAFGVQDLMFDMGADYEKVQPEVDACLRRFFMARIGLRFLLQHHIESFKNRDGYSGILQLECNAAAVARKAAQDSTMLCRAHLGQAPPVVITEHVIDPDPFTYVPMHMHYMLLELLKNACRATVEHQAEGWDDALPSVTIDIVYGNEDVIFKISDEGGGISRARLQDVWKFMYSTYSVTPWATLRKDETVSPGSADSSTNPLQRPRLKSAGGVLAGYGVGLTLSRLYAQYFGGDLKILSMDGFGTDAYLHLSRLGRGCENLPRGVLYSPSMGDSSPVDSTSEEHFLISTDEAAFLKRELERMRRENPEHQSE